MKVKTLQMKRALRAALLVLLLSVVGMTKGYAYDFSAVCSTGQTLYYTITDATNHHVKLTHPVNNENNYGIYVWGNYTKPTGDIVLPYSVSHNGISYILTEIGDFALTSCGGLTGSLVIPNSVTRIGIRAFFNCNGFTGSLTIPNSVAEIGHSAFELCAGFSEVYFNAVNCADVTGTFYNYETVTCPFSRCGEFSLTIGDNVERIPAHMFESCVTGSLTIPNSVTEIGEFAFHGSNELTSLTIPGLVSSIGCNAFGGITASVYYDAENCADALECISSPSSSPYYTSPFYGCTGTLTIGNNVERIPANMFSYSSFTGSLNIPNSVTSIGDKAFYHCNIAGTLTIPNSVVEIGEFAFSDCGFSEVYFNAANCADAILGSNPFIRCSGILSIGDNVERIPNYMFDSGDFTGPLTISASIAEIGVGAFDRCDGLTSVYYTGSIEQWCNILFRGDYGANPLYYAHDLYINDSIVRDLTIPSTITEIKPYAFIGATCLTSLTIPNSVTSIGDCAFAGCSGFTGTLTIPNSVTSIGEAAFGSCNGFTGSLIIPNSVTSIGIRAFAGCSGFTGTLTIPNSVTSIGSYAFENCSGFGTLTIPNSVTEIKSGVFTGCSGFTGTLTIPNSVTSIGFGAFSGCSGFVSLTIPDSVTELNKRAFYNCSGLTGGLVIPNSVTRIGVELFSGCSGLTSVTLGNAVKRIDVMAFKNCSGLMDFIIPASVNDIGSHAFDSCSNLSTIVALRTEPPYLYTIDAFANISPDANLFVPCGCQMAYYSAWNYVFGDRIHEDCDLHPIGINTIGVGGNVSSSTIEAAMGEEVQLTVTPNAGMSLSSLVVCNATNPLQTISVYPIDKVSSLYGFIMPPFAVLVSATFVPGTSVGENNSISIPANVYPNPTGGQVTIEAEDLKQITISNVLGQIVYEGKANGYAFEYDFGKHDVGVYVVRIETANGVATKRVVSAR